MMMPPLVLALASMRRTTTRSCNGRNLVFAMATSLRRDAALKLKKHCYQWLGRAASALASGGRYGMGFPLSSQRAMRAG
jgi:hypothetical protein